MSNSALLAQEEETIETYVKIEKVGEATTSPFFIIVDHATNALPLTPDEKTKYNQQILATDNQRAWDHDHYALNHATNIAKMMGGATLIAPKFGRFFIDVNRSENSTDLIPAYSFDQTTLPWNKDISTAEYKRRLQFHAKYHEIIADKLNQHSYPCLISIHTFPADMMKENKIDVCVTFSPPNTLAQNLAKFLNDKKIKVGENDPFSGKGPTLTKGRTLQIARDREIPHVLLEISAANNGHNTNCRKIHTHVAAGLKLAYAALPEKR